MGYNLENRRAALRVSVSAEGTIYRRRGSLVGDSPFVCHIQNISSGGMCFLCEEEFDVGDQFYLHLEEQGRLGTMTLYGDIVWQSVPSPEYYQHGARLYSEDGSPSQKLTDAMDVIIGTSTSK